MIFVIGTGLIFSEIQDFSAAGELWIHSYSFCTGRLFSDISRNNVFLWNWNLTSPEEEGVYTSERYWKPLRGNEVGQLVWDVYLSRKFAYRSFILNNEKKSEILIVSIFFSDRKKKNLIALRTDNSDLSGSSVVIPCLLTYGAFRLVRSYV